MAQERYVTNAIRLRDGRVLIAGGLDEENVTLEDCDGFYPAHATELYDPAKGTFAASGIARWSVDTAILQPDGKVLALACTIADDKVTSHAQLYDPASGRFTDLRTKPLRRVRPTLALLSSGDVLITGGSSVGGDVSSAAELYSHGRVHLVANMRKARNQHTATRLRDGKVLVVGGFSNINEVPYTPVSEIEIFDPASGHFALVPGAKMIRPRGEHSAILLKSGKVLIVGGEDKDGQSHVPTAEIYDPTLRRFEVVAGVKIPPMLAPPALLNDGRVLIVRADPPFAGQAEFLDIDAARLSLGPMMVHPHVASTAVPLADGRVLFVGGFGDMQRENRSFGANNRQRDWRAAPMAGEFSVMGSQDAELYVP